MLCVCVLECKDLFISAWGLQLYTELCRLLCVIDCCNGVQKWHLQCRSLSYNAAVVCWAESIVSLGQGVFALLLNALTQIIFGKNVSQ